MQKSDRLKAIEQACTIVRWHGRYTDLDLGKIKAHLSRYGDEYRPGVRSRYVTDEQYSNAIKRIELRLAQREQSNHVPISDGIPDFSQMKRPSEGYLTEFSRKCYDKFFGVQGGTPTAQMVCDKLQEYYDNVSVPHLPEPTPWVMAEIAGELSVPESFQPSSTEVYHLWSGDHRSCGGVTYWGDRRLRQAYSKSLSDAERAPVTVDPAVTGTRNQRNKPIRVIFMDAFANQFRAMKQLRYWHAILENSPLVAWKGDRFVEKTVSVFLNKVGDFLVFESDYESYDTWVTLTHALWTDDRINDFFPHKTDAERAFIRALWTQKVITPHGLREGEHTLFSGQPPTQDVESWLNIFINLSFVEDVVEPLLRQENKLLPDAHLELHRDFELVVCGDDVIILFAAKYFRETAVPAALPAQFSEWVWKTFRIRARADKQGVSYGAGQFCKRIYPGIKDMQYPNVPGTVKKSIYPFTLVWNSILHPEEESAANCGQAVIRAATLCDNAWGDPMWKQLVSDVYEVLPWIRNCVTVDPKDWDAVNDRMRAWRVILAGEKYSAENSPTIQYWVKRTMSEQAPTV